MTRLVLTVNGVPWEGEVEAQLTLLELLRERLYLTGAKEGCGVGECGACLVLVDGVAVNSCLMLAADAHGRAVETVEGIGTEARSGVQEAFVEAGAVQCGFCTPGMVVAATALLRANPQPSGDEAAAALGAVLCRCGTYPRVLAALRLAAEGGAR
jgi:aerobic carbon-monoxide dehydrogenase small subunit